MTRIYKTHTLPDHYQWFKLSNDRDREAVLDTKEGESLANVWRPIQLIWGDENASALPTSDITTVSLAHFAANERARAVLCELTQHAVEFLPVLTPTGSTLWIANITNVIEFLDKERFKGATRHYPKFSVTSMIFEYAFLCERLEGQCVFVDPIMKRSELYVSEEFVTRVQETGIVGFAFEEIYKC